MLEEKKRILLINPSYSFLYKVGKTRTCVIYTPSINLAVIAAPLIQDGHTVKISDFNKTNSEFAALEKELLKFGPDYVGITFTTPLALKAAIFASLIKKFDKQIKVVAGGVHVTSFPEAVLRESDFDMVVVGEGDFVFSELLKSRDMASVGNLVYKENGNILSNPRNKLIKDLDMLLESL